MDYEDDIFRESQHSIRITIRKCLVMNITINRNTRKRNQTLPCSQSIQLFHAGSHPPSRNDCGVASSSVFHESGGNGLLLVRRRDFLNHVLHVVQRHRVDHKAVSVEGGLVGEVGEAVLEPGLHVLVRHGLDAGELADLVEQGGQFLSVAMQGDEVLHLTESQTLLAFLLGFLLDGQVGEILAQLQDGVVLQGADLGGFLGEGRGDGQGVVQSVESVAIYPANFCPL